MIRTLMLVLALIWVRPALADEVQDRIATLLTEQQLTGAVWAMVTPDGPPIIGAAGLANHATGQPMTPPTRVQVGSIPKALIATGILRLVTEGRLSLDMPVADILPDVAVDNPWAATHPLRLRHLVDHTAGLDDARFWQVFTLQSKPDDPLIDGITRKGTALRLRTPPGERFSYSNTSFTMLGMVIEAVTGQRYEAWLGANLLAPLGMQESNFAFVTQTGDPNLAMGHFENGETQAAVPSPVRPAGQFTTSAADMARFAQFLMGDGRVDGDLLVAPDLLRAMGQPVETEAARAGLLVGYRLGLQRRDRHGVQGLCHAGNGIGWRAMLCVFPDAEKAFFVAQNTDSETANYNLFDAALIQALELAPLPLPAATFGDDRQQWLGTYVPAPNRFAQFAYLDMMFGAVSVDETTEGLRLSNPQRADRHLLSVGRNLYRLSDRTEASHVFLRTANGDAVLSDGVQTFQRVAESTRWLGWTCLALGLVGLSWLLLSGLGRLVMRRRTMSSMIALSAVLSLLLPLPFLLFGQSFLELGDPTIGSLLLALVTGALPAGLLLALFRQWREGGRGWLVMADRLALVGALQWLVVLAAYGLVPLRLYA